MRRSSLAPIFTLEACGIVALAVERHEAAWPAELAAPRAPKKLKLVEAGGWTVALNKWSGGEEAAPCPVAVYELTPP